jgi:heptosyltransferase-2
VKAPAASRPGEAKAVLVVLPTWVGDFVMATPALRAIRAHFAEAKIMFLAEENLRELIRGGDWMDECVYWPARDRRRPWHREYRTLQRELRKRRFDWAILLPNAFRAALIAWLSGARRRIGYHRDGRGPLLTDRVPIKNRVNGKLVPLPLVEYYADLAEAMGCARPDDRLELFTTPDCDESLDKHLHQTGIAGKRPLVVISPGAKYGAAKCWMPERFAAVADRLTEEAGAAVAVTCGPGEEHIARAIVSAMRRPAVVFDDPRLSLGELKSLIRRSDLLLCNDAGPRHFAKAFGVPVVTVFGPTHTEWTATRYLKERIVRIDVDCGPCQQRVCPEGHLKCMTGVTVEAVLDACAELLPSHAGQEAS